MKTVLMIVSIAAFLMLRAVVKALLLPFRALRNLRRSPSAPA